MTDTVQRIMVECECIHADAAGNVKSIEREDIPALIIKDEAGNVTSITTEV
jgi:hypothetical protein